MAVCAHHPAQKEVDTLAGRFAFRSLQVLFCTFQVGQGKEISVEMDESVFYVCVAGLDA